MRERDHRLVIIIHRTTGREDRYRLTKRSRSLVTVVLIIRYNRLVWIDQLIANRSSRVTKRRCCIALGSLASWYSYYLQEL